MTARISSGRRQGEQAMAQQIYHIFSLRPHEASFFHTIQGLHREVSLTYSRGTLAPTGGTGRYLIQMLARGLPTYSGTRKPSILYLRSHPWVIAGRNEHATQLQDPIGKFSIKKPVGCSR